MPEPKDPASTSQLGMVGLGRMGAAMLERLVAAGIACSAYDLDTAAIERAAAAGATGATDPAALVESLTAPRSIWVMVPAAFVDDAIEKLLPHLEPGDTLIDGGNSHYHDDIRRGDQLRRHGLHYLDVGTSGGVAGRERGYCLMIGGDGEAVSRLAPVFDALAPGVDAAPRTPGRTGDAPTEEHGWLHCGPTGAGHFVKMVHNGIEYGVMAAYAEGLALLQHANVGATEQSHNAETTPLRHPEQFRYQLDIAAITELWRRGSVISSWLLDLTAAGLVADPDLGRFDGRVSDSGEGRWTLEAGIETGTPMPVLAAALFGRFTSRGEGVYANKVLSAMRQQFGGHQEVRP